MRYYIFTCLMFLTTIWLPHCKLGAIISDISRDLVGLVGGCNLPLLVQGKTLVKARWQSSWYLQGLSTPKSRTFD